MDIFETSHFSRQALRHELKTWDGKDRTTAAVLLSRIAEFDAREIYLEDGYPSMHAYCIRELNYCEGTASRRIYAARTARRFPLIFSALAEGHVHLTAVILLARYLTEGNVGELIHAATHKTTEEIYLLIAERFPRRDLPERLVMITPPPPPLPPVPARSDDQHSPENAGESIFSSLPACPPAPQHSPENAAASDPPSRMTPLAPQKFSFQCTLDQETYELWRYAKALLSHEIPKGEIPLVLKKVLAMAVEQLEKRKFAKTDRPGHPKGCVDPRSVPAADKREAWVRDEGRCTFVSDTGRRCGSDHQLEFHHNDEIARGGPSVAKNLRLLCKAHHRHETERSFGAEFIERKQREARVEASARAAAKARARELLSSPVTPAA
jgi:HNH endonuclease